MADVVGGYEPFDKSRLVEDGKFFIVSDTAVRTDSVLAVQVLPGIVRIALCGGQTLEFTRRHADAALIGAGIYGSDYYDSSPVEST